MINSWQINDETFILDSRYKVNDFLGAGAYGVVISACDTLSNTVVAIKKCKSVLFQSKTISKRTVRELRLLRLLNHENIIKLITILNPSDLMNFNEIYAGIYTILTYFT